MTTFPAVSYLLFLFSFSVFLGAVRSLSLCHLFFLSSIIVFQLLFLGFPFDFYFLFPFISFSANSRTELSFIFCSAQLKLIIISTIQSLAPLNFSPPSSVFLVLTISSQPYQLPYCLKPAAKQSVCSRHTSNIYTDKWFKGEYGDIQIETGNLRVKLHKCKYANTRYQISR